MRRLSRSGKGQWFLISAVIASGIFLTISGMLKDYFSVPADLTNSENVYFDGIRDGAIATLQGDCTKGSGVLTNKENITEFVYFAKKKMAELGYLLEVAVKGNIVCSAPAKNFHAIILKSDDIDIWEGTRPNIRGIDDVKFRENGDLESFEIEFQNSVDYDFTVNVSIYDSEGFVNSVLKGVRSGNDKVKADNLDPAVPRLQGMYTRVYSIYLIGAKRWDI